MRNSHRMPLYLYGALLLIAFNVSACRLNGPQAALAPSSTPTPVAPVAVTVSAMIVSPLSTSMPTGTAAPGPSATPTRALSPSQVLFPSRTPVGTLASLIPDSPQNASGVRPACPGAPASRLIIQERGIVTDNGRNLNLREGPATDYDIIAALQPGERFMVLDGPDCAEAYAWFRVQVGQRLGWIAEGDLETYYAKPFFPG